MRLMSRSRGDRKRAQAPDQAPRLLVGFLLLALAAVPLGIGQQVASATTRTSVTPKSSGALTFKATGYFAVDKKDGQWWLVTPTGQPFYAAGIDAVTAQGEV
jgi:hypothetical protein